MRARRYVMSSLGLSALLGLCASCGDNNRLSKDAAPVIADARTPDAGAGAESRFLHYRAPAGDRPATRSTPIDGYDAAILPNGRIVTPVGRELQIQAPKPFGLAVAPDGQAAITTNSGSTRFSVTLIKNPTDVSVSVKRIPLNATFMGAALSPDGNTFYASGGENGNIWVGDMTTGEVLASVNLNGDTHPLPSPSVAEPFPPPSTQILSSFRGAFPGNLVVSPDGRYLYVVDQASFRVHVIDTTLIGKGIDTNKRILDMNNFAAVVASVEVGRYPFGISLSPDGKTLFVTNVGIFRYTHLIPRGASRQPGGTEPPNPSGDPNEDYPLCFPVLAYPDDMEQDKTVRIKKIDAANISTLPLDLRDPDDGIRCGYVSADRDYTVPGLGSPNVEESSSVYIINVSTPTAPVVTKRVKTGLLVGDVEHDIEVYGASHPNSVAIGTRAIYVSNGNNDSISVLDPSTFEVVRNVPLSPFTGKDVQLKGIQPVSVALSPDENWLYVAEAGINAVAVLSLEGTNAQVVGHIPTGWWPSSVKVSGDGKLLFVANAKGRGAPPSLTGDVPNPSDTPKHSVYGSVQVIDVPDMNKLAEYTDRVMKNNGFVEVPPEERSPDHPIPSRAGVPSQQIKHVILIIKENLTHDLVLGDIVQTREGVPVNGDPSLSLGYDASPNHHELALGFAFGDNFYLEPAVSSDGHRWTTNIYPSEFEETHWPASYGGKRNDTGDNEEMIESWFGRIAFSDANASAEPHDYPQHGNLFLHLHRNGKTFINFGEGHELALVQEPRGAEPTGIRQRTNIPMQTVLRDNTDHLYPQYNTTIPDSPLPEDPDRFNRYGRFEQVFNSKFSVNGECRLPDFTYILYPNDHGGGANDINGPDGAAWDFKRFVQDNDSALGRTVQLISNSPCWKDTVIFVTEDDTQSGLDHVNGYRTLFLVISPWVKREYVSKTHYSLASLFKTIHLILGLPPLNQYDAAASDLSDFFDTTADMTPYQYVTPQFAARAKASWKKLTRNIDFTELDANEVAMRKAILKSEGLPRKNTPPYHSPKAGRPKQ